MTKSELNLRRICGLGRTPGRSQRLQANEFTAQAYLSSHAKRYKLSWKFLVNHSMPIPITFNPISAMGLAA